MLISHHNRFLFIHIQKTAGSSLSQLLKENVADLSSFRGTHDHALWAKSAGGFIWEDYYKFAFVRNPWDRLVSWYMMITQHSQRLLLEQPGYEHNLLWRYVLENADSFESFIHNCTACIDDVDGRKSFVFNQLDYLTDEAGNCIVDFIGRFETFSADTLKLCDALGLDNVAISHTNTSTHAHYRDYYNDVTRRLVAQRFAKDIDYFSYQF